MDAIPCLHLCRAPIAAHGRRTDQRALKRASEPHRKRTDDLPRFLSLVRSVWHTEKKEEIEEFHTSLTANEPATCPFFRRPPRSLNSALSRPSIWSYPNHLHKDRRTNAGNGGENAGKLAKKARMKNPACRATVAVIASKVPCPDRRTAKTLVWFTSAIPAFARLLPNPHNQTRNHQYDSCFLFPQHHHYRHHHQPWTVRSVCVCVYVGVIPATASSSCPELNCPELNCPNP